MVIDGDRGWQAVDDRLAPALLPAGTLADLVNGTLEFGDVRGRWGVQAPPWGALAVAGLKPLALRAMNDSNGERFLVLITEGWRADGGFGRAWRIMSNNAPLEIPLGGHDVWGECRMVPVRGGLVLLRHGNVRYYWAKNDGTPNFDVSSRELTFNTLEGLFTGDRVQVVYGAGGMTLAPAEFFVRATGVRVSFHPTRADAMAGTNKREITVPQAGTCIYLEKLEAVAAAGQYQSTAPLPLLLESKRVGAAVVESWNNGFRSVRAAVTAEIAPGETEWRAGNHNFAPGQAVQLTNDVGGFAAAGTYYVNPLDEGRFTLHALLDEALLGIGPVAAAAGAATYVGSLRPKGFSRALMPGGREGCFAFNRLIIATGMDGLAVSDSGDFLHFYPMTSAKVANLGEATRIQAVVPVGENGLVVLKRDSALLVSGLEQSPGSWTLTELVREYGCVASRTAVQVGRDVWFLSRNGIMSVVQTVQGKMQGVQVPISQPLSGILARVDWARAEGAAAAWWNNRYLLSVPLIGSEGVNTATLVYNFLTGGWEGYWQGFDVLEFARLEVAGKLRLCFVSSDGRVRYFNEEALTDGGVPIAGRAVFRGFKGTGMTTVQWQEVGLILDTWAPRFDVEVRLPGVNESQVVRKGVTLSRDRSFLFGDARIPGDRRPYGEDYSPGLNAPMGVELNRFQTVSVRYPLAARDISAQVVVAWSEGCVRVRSVWLAGVAERVASWVQP